VRNHTSPVIGLGTYRVGRSAGRNTRGPTTEIVDSEFCWDRTLQNE